MQTIYSQILYSKMQFFPFSYIVTWCKRMNVSRVCPVITQKAGFLFQSSFHLKVEHIGRHRLAYFRLVSRMQQFSPFPTLLHGARGFECQKSLLRHHTKGRASFLVIFSPEGGAHWAAQVCIFQYWYLECNNFPHFLTLLHGARGFECQKSLLRHHTKGKASFFTQSSFSAPPGAFKAGVFIHIHMQTNSYMGIPYNKLNGGVICRNQ